MSRRHHRRWFLILAAGLVGWAFLGLLAGGVVLTPTQILTGARPFIFQNHLARVLLGIIAGAGLSVSGCLQQSILRNPLADPYILGTSSGAGLGAAIAIVAGAGPAWLPLAAFCGAAAATFIVYRLARVRGQVPSQTLLLAGVVIGFIMGSVLMCMVAMSSREGLHDLLWWLLGNLETSDWQMLAIVGAVVAAGTAGSIFFAGHLNAMTLGDEPAQHLGLRVERAKLHFFLLASLMTGAIVAACGIIAFVGLIVPHVMRIVLGPDHRYLLPGAAIGGAIFLVAADAFAQTVLSPAVIPVGMVTALLGGPLFLYLLRRMRELRWN